MTKTKLCATIAKNTIVSYNDTVKQILKQHKNVLIADQSLLKTSVIVS